MRSGMDAGDADAGGRGEGLGGMCAQVRRRGNRVVGSAGSGRAGTLAPDVVVVGGGIAGVLSAVRLADGGATVTLLERGALGSGATVGNHGIVHSGAMYAQHHADVLDHCQRAQAMVQEEFPEALLGVFPSVYFGHADRVDAVAAALTCAGVEWAPALRSTLTRHGLPAGTHAVTVEETIASSRLVLVDLVARARAFGVRILSGAPVGELDRRRGCWRVGLPGGEHLVTGTVVLAAGEGNRRLLSGLVPRAAAFIGSRLELMIYLPGCHLAGPVFCLDYGGPTLVPALDGALVSFHGAPRLDVDDRAGRPVPLARANQLLAAATVFPGLTDVLADAVAYTCVKTEWADDQADRWGSRPEHAVIDHSDDGMPRLFSVIPGKMTLAFHATGELAQRVLGGPVPLAPPRPDVDTLAGTAEAAGQVALEPWRTRDLDQTVRAS